MGDYIGIQRVEGLRSKLLKGGFYRGQSYRLLREILGVYTIVDVDV